MFWFSCKQACLIHHLLLQLFLEEQNSSLVVEHFLRHVVVQLVVLLEVVVEELAVLLEVLVLELVFLLEVLLLVVPTAYEAIQACGSCVPSYLSASDGLGLNLLGGMSSRIL